MAPPEEHTMTTTTSYGTWCNHYSLSAGVENVVADFLGDQADGFDVDGLVEAFRDGINDLLPEGVTLAGNDFYGPDPRPSDYAETIVEAIVAVDLGELAKEYDLS
jgi:hypothetical protein